MAPIFENAIHKLRGERHVIDVRNLGLVGGVELAPRAGAPGARAYDVFVRCFEKGVLTRYTGDILVFSPPLIIEEAQIDEIFKAVGRGVEGGGLGDLRKGVCIPPCSRARQDDLSAVAR